MIKRAYIILIENQRYKNIQYLNIKDLLTDEYSKYLKNIFSDVIDDLYINIVESNFEFFIKSYIYTNKYNLIDYRNVVDDFLVMNFIKPILDRNKHLTISDIYFIYITPKISISSTLINYIQYSTYYRKNRIDNKFVIDIDNNFIYKINIIETNSLFGKTYIREYKLKKHDEVINEIIDIVKYIDKYIENEPLTDVYIKLLSLYNKKYIDVYNEIFIYENKNQFNVLSRFLLQNPNNIKYLTEYYNNITNEIQFNFGNIDSCFCLEYYLPLKLNNISVDYFKNQTDLYMFYDIYKVYQPLNAFLNIFIESVDNNIKLDKYLNCNENFVIYSKNNV